MKKKKKPPVKKEPLTFSAQLLRSADRLGGDLSRRRAPWQVYLCAFFLPFAILFVLWAFNGVILGNKMILAHDQWHQYYPFFLDLQRKLRSGGSLFYSWTNAMGTNFLSMGAYYLASPMNLLVGLLPESLALTFYTFTVMVKISLAGLFFAIFLRKLFDRSDFSIVFFSVMYAFCAFICGYYWNAIWLDTVALLPLVALGTVSLLRDRKFILYTVALFLSVFSSYYVGLFTCIFVLLLFICYNICYWDDLGGFGIRLVRIAFFSLLAIGMTALLSVPAFLGLQATSSAVNKFPDHFALNITKDQTAVGLIDGIRQIFSQLGTGILPTSMEGLPNVACGTVTAVLAISYFCTKKIPLREKLCCAGLLLFFCLSFLIRQLDYIWHGFHFPNMLPYRFSFLFSFVLIFMAYRAFTQIDQWRWYHCLYLAPFAVLLLFCVFSQQRLPIILLTTVLVLVSVAALFLFAKKLLTKNLLVVILCVLLLGEAAVSAIRGSQQVRFTDATVYPKLSSDVQQVLDTAKEREADTVDLWRTETTLTQTLNDNALNGYNGISTFSSAANCGVSQFLKSIGLPASVAGNRYAYEETVPLTNMMLGLKYLIDRDNLSVERPYFDSVSTSGSVNLLENKAYIPMGFMLSTDALDYDSDVRINSTRTENINYLYQLLSGSRANVLESYPMAEQTADEGLELTGSGSQFTVKKTETADSTAKAHFTYRIDSDCHFCFYTAAQELNNLSVELNGISVTNYNTKYGYLRDCGLLHAGDELTLSCAPKSADKNGVLTVYAGTFDDAAFDALYRQLSEHHFNATSVTDTSVEGEITAAEDGICYFSIPYDKGWSVSVDGKKASAVSVFGAFIGLRLAAGTHAVSLHYETPGFSTGLTVSYICLAIFLVLVLIALLRRLFTRPMQQVDMEMIGSPAKKAEKRPESEPQEAAYTEPIEEAPAVSEPIPEAPSMEQTQMIPTEELREEDENPSWDSLMEDVDGLLQDAPAAELSVTEDQTIVGMPALFDEADEAPEIQE